MIRARTNGDGGGRGRSLILFLGFVGSMLALPVSSGAAAAPGDETVVDGVVIAPDRATLYAPLEKTAAALELPPVTAGEGQSLLLGTTRIPRSDLETMPDGTRLVRLRLLAEIPDLEVTVAWDAEREAASVRRGERELLLRRGRHTLADGITFAAVPRALYLPARELAEALGLPEDALPASPGAARPLADGLPLLPIEEFRDAAALSWSPKKEAACLIREERELWVRRAPKRVALNLREQRMRAWEGRRLVLDTHISSGRRGMSTPTGAFRAGPLKSPLVISRRYGNARMPWSVQVHGNIFIHGYPSVPSYPASHGCIRVPLTGRNPARWFYDWITLGTPIRIEQDWHAGQPA